MCGYAGILRYSRTLNLGRSGISSQRPQGRRQRRKNFFLTICIIAFLSPRVENVAIKKSIMAHTSLNPIALLNKAAVGLSMAFVLSPVLVTFPSQAQTARSAQPQRAEVSQPRRSTSPTAPTSPTGASVIRTTGDEGPTPVANAGGCSGVNDCNNFIAICIGGGGTYVPGTHNSEGQPTSGSCDVE